MYSAVGMNIYPYVKWGNGITEKNNFTTFWLSFWTLFKCAGGENWSYILADISITDQSDLFIYNYYQLIK